MNGHMNFKYSSDHAITFSDWLESFDDVYMSVVGQEILKQMVNMLKHKAIVWYLHKQKKGTRVCHVYGLKFRRDMASPDLDTNWGDFESHVFDEATLEGTISDQTVMPSTFHPSHNKPSQIIRER